MKKVIDAGLSDLIKVDSAGTTNWHEGHLPDSRTVRYAKEKGYDLSFIKSRQVKADDFVKHDLILAMDKNNLSILQILCPDQYTHKLSLFLNLADDIETQEVPDPYYAGNGRFDRVLMLIEYGSHALLRYIQQYYL